MNKAEERRFYIKDISTDEYYNIEKKWDKGRSEPLFFNTEKEAGEYIEKYIKLKNLIERRKISINKILILNNLYIYEKEVTNVLEKFIVLDLVQFVFMSENISNSKKVLPGFYDGFYQYAKREYRKEKVYIKE